MNLSSLARRRKWLVTVATFAAGLIDLGFVHATPASPPASFILALNSAGVHAVPNKPRTTT